MAEHPNVEMIRQGYEAFARGDMSALADLAADEVVWHVPGDHSLAGDYEGKLAVIGFLAGLTQTLGVIEQEVHDIVGNDDHVVEMANQKLTRPDGDVLEWRAVQIFHVAAGKVTEVWAFNENQAEIDKMVP